MMIALVKWFLSIALLVMSSNVESPFELEHSKPSFSNQKVLYPLAISMGITKNKNHGI